MSAYRALIAVLLLVAPVGCIGIVGTPDQDSSMDATTGAGADAPTSTAPPVGQGGSSPAGGAAPSAGGWSGGGGDTPGPVLCGDGDCDTTETCGGCPSDCGECPAGCGDGDCDGTEDCASCPVDCGTCPPSCGDGDCNGTEDCASCPIDCGGCQTTCGNGQCDGTEDCSSCPGDCGGVDIPSDFAGVIWLHTDVSGWAQTANLSSVTVSSSQICLNHDKADVWPGLDHVGAFVNGNPWIFIRHNHQWYAATWEWMRHGQTCKNRSSVAGDHIKQDPFWSFQPRSGACYGFMVSGLARDSTRNVHERSQVRKIQWP